MAINTALPVPTQPLDPTNPQSIAVWNNYYLSLTNTGGTIPPINAEYIVATSNPELTNEINLGALTTGILFITVAAGIAVPSTLTVIPLARGGTNADLSATGGAGRVLKQLSAGAAITVAAITASDLNPLASVYTPTLFNVTNLSASTAFQCQYLQVGTTVTVSGKVSIDPTAAGACELGISIPIASNFGAEEDCGGVAFAPAIAGQGAAILADSTNDRAAMKWIAVDVTNQSMFFSFTYRVI